MPRWAKTARDGGTGFHLLLAHGLDVAAVLRAGLARNPRLLATLAGQLGMVPEATLRMLVALAILHDAGKCAGSFQAMVESVAASLGVPTEGLCRYDSRTCHHGRVGQALLHEVIRRGGFGAARRAQDILELLATFTGHHGEPPRGDETAADFRRAWSEADVAAAGRLVSAALAISGWDGTAPPLAAVRRASYLLAGLATLCDHLGSSDRFAFREQDGDAAEYFAATGEVARELIEEVSPAAFRPLAPPPRRGFAALFAHLSEPGPPPRPTPMQAAVEALAADLPDGPLLLVIEDLTGSGKTEAADLFVHALLASGRASGAYYGLPTMATANAAYQRKLLALREVAGADADLVLAHSGALGARGLSTRARFEPGEAAPHEWFNRSARRALLAGTGVGTVDQALAGALRAKLGAYRLFGLWGKVLVVDEVHACDPYMTALLGRVLRRHAQLGGSAVLLSATLPRDLHHRLARDFGEGAGWEDRGAPEPPRYPGFTLHHTGGTVPQHVDPHRVPEPVQLRRAGSVKEVQCGVLDWLRAGRSVLWFRNTVADAVAAEQELAPALSEAGLAPAVLYHARFLPDDRSRIERDVERIAGKSARPADRAGRLIIATQVAEQSLDLDADELVSDLCPADGLIQRLGRRRRHLRDANGTLLDDGPDRRPPSAAVLFAPDPDSVRDARWCAALLPRTGAIYPDVAQLWLTAHVLLDVEEGLGGRFRPVEDARTVLDRVYPAGSFDAGDPPPLPGVPEPLRRTLDTAEGAALEDRRHAARHSLPFAEGWVRDWWSAANVRVEGEALPTTQLGERHEVVLLERVDGGGARLLGGTMDDSTCRFPYRLQSTPESAKARGALARGGGLAPGEGDRLRLADAVLLDQEGTGWTGDALKEDSATRVAVLYCGRYGLRLA